MATYVHEFPPDMVPESGLGTKSHTDPGQGSDLISGGHAIVYVPTWTQPSASTPRRWG
jgi:hypothetical protein